MDNASKALIMAGAILIAVALVGIGVYLYQSASGTVTSGVDQLNAASMETKNSNIEQFEGTIKGSELKQLIRRVNAYNENEIFPDQLTFAGSTSITSDSSITSYTAYTTAGIQNSKEYTITLTYADGWVSVINVD